MMEQKMPRRFSHLKWKQRLKIDQMNREGYKVQQIADALHVHNSTIYRELERGRTQQRTYDWELVEVYCPETAERKYRENLAAKGPDLKIANDHELAAYIEEKIHDEKYSPAAVLNKIKEEGRVFSVEISKWTLYSYITKGVFLTITNKDLPVGARKKQKHRKVKEARLPKGDSIENRAEDINNRTEPFHWEMDTVVSAGKSKKRLLVLTERLTRDEIIVLMKDGTMASVVQALDRLERGRGARRFAQVFKTITVDYGSEFQDCAGIERSCLRKQPRTHIYYCHPYSAYERGTNEVTNRMVRRWLPKGTSFDKLTRKEVQRIEDWINDYPREILGGRCARNVMQEYLDGLTG